MAVRFPAVKSPLYLTENLSGGELPHVLWRWHVGLLSPPKSAKPPLDNRLEAPRHLENPADDTRPSLGSDEVDFVMGEVLEAYIPILGGCILTESNPKKGSKSRERLAV